MESRAVLEAVSQIADATVDTTLPEIQSRLADLEIAQHQHRMTVDERGKIEHMVRDLRSRRDVAKREIDQLQDPRGPLLAAIFLGEATQDTDAANETRRRESEGLVVRFDLAAPFLQRRLTDRQQPMRNAADCIAGIQEQSRNARRQAKLEIARKRAAQ